MEEKRKWIKGFEGLYWITNTGRVISADRFDRFNRKVGGELKLGLRGQAGYLGLTLFKDGVGYQRLVHRLVADAFVPNPDNKPCVDHIDGNNKNNNANNLRWVTYKENMNNPVTYARMLEDTSKFVSQVGANNPFSRKVRMYSLNGEYIRTFDCLSDTSRFCGVGDNSIGRVCRGERFSAGGYKWAYEGEANRKISGHITLPTNKRGVLQYNSDGVLIEEYGSIAEAAKATGFQATNIIHAAKGDLKTYKGYRWKYKE